MKKKKQVLKKNINYKINNNKTHHFLYKFKSLYKNKLIKKIIIK